MLHVVPHLATVAGCSVYAAPRHLHLASIIVTPKSAACLQTDGAYTVVGEQVSGALRASDM